MSVSNTSWSLVDIRGQGNQDTSYLIDNNPGSVFDNVIRKYERQDEETTVYHKSSSQQVNITDLTGNNVFTGGYSTPGTTLRATFGAGNDEFHWSQAAGGTGDSIAVNMGNGDNYVNMGKFTNTGKVSDANAFSITTGSGSDIIAVDSGGNVNVASGSGNDTIDVHSAYLKSININAGAGQDTISVPLAAGTVVTKEYGTAQEGDVIHFSNPEKKQINSVTLRESGSEMFIEISFGTPPQTMRLVMGENDKIIIAGQVYSRGALRTLSKNNALLAIFNSEIRYTPLGAGTVDTTEADNILKRDIIDFTNYEGQKITSATLKDNGAKMELTLSFGSPARTMTLVMGEQDLLMLDGYSYTRGDLRRAEFLKKGSIVAAFNGTPLPLV